MPSTASVRNNGTLQGGATDTGVGEVGQCFSLNGTTAYVSIPDSPTFHPANLTVEAWVLFTSLNSTASGGSPAGQQYIVFKQNTRSGGFEGFYLGKERGTGGDHFVFAVSSSAGVTAEADSGPVIATNVWYHVAGVRGSNFVQLYLNGALAGSASVSFAQDYGTLPLFFGSSGESYWDHKLSGLLDEVSLYNRPLASNEIAAIYAAGSAGKCQGPQPPVVTIPPQSQSVASGGTASFIVSATGTAPLNYQWQFNGGPIPGATATNLTLTNVQLTNGGSYTVVVTNAVNSVTSAPPAVLTVLTPPVITLQPQGATNLVGATVVFTAAATGSAPLSYQWQFNSVNLTNGARISGSQTGTLTISNAQVTDTGNYVLLASNGAGATNTLPASLTINGPPAITAQPAPESVFVGANASFSVAATGTQPLSYQWFRNSLPLSDAGNISGSATATLSLTNVQLTDSANFQVVISNVAGTTNSALVALIVTAPGACDPPPANLVGWWTGNGTATDIAGGNNGTLQAGATDTGVGEVGQCFSFNGTTAYVSIPDSPTFHPAVFTVEAWVKFTSLNSTGSGGSPAGDQYIVFKQNSQVGNFEGFDLSKARISGKDVFRFLVTSASAQSAEIDTTTALATNVWYHIAAVRGSNYTQLYVNGQLAGQLTVNFPQDYGTLPLFFGTSGRILLGP